MTHPNEPSIEDLKRIRQDLYGEQSTSENVKKIEAIEKQIARKEAQSATDSHPSDR
jgi:hypothetical protein